MDKGYITILDDLFIKLFITTLQEVLCLLSMINIEWKALPFINIRI